MESKLPKIALILWPEVYLKKTLKGMGQDEDLLPAFVGRHGPSHLTQIRNLLLFHLFILQNYISDEFYVPDFPETALKPGTL